MRLPAGLYLLYFLIDDEKLALRVKIGRLYCCYVGLATGHYSVDVKKFEELRGVKRLAGLSAVEAKVFISQALIHSFIHSFIQWVGRVTRTLRCVCVLVPSPVQR